MCRIDLCAAISGLLLMACLPNSMLETAFPEAPVRDWRFGAALDAPRSVSSDALNSDKSEFIGPLGLLLWLAYSPIPEVTFALEMHEGMGLTLRTKVATLSGRHWALAFLGAAGFTSWSNRAFDDDLLEEGFAHFYDIAMVGSLGAHLDTERYDEVRISFSVGPKVRYLHADLSDYSDDVYWAGWLQDQSIFTSVALDAGGSRLMLEFSMIHLDKIPGLDRQWMPSFGLSYSYGW